MQDQIREKLSKIYELVQSGATAGEQAAARNALDRIVSKYNLTDEDLNNINLKEYVFKYASKMEKTLMVAIVRVFLNNGPSRTTICTYCNNTCKRVKEFRIRLTYLEFVTVESAYGYFRAHMKHQWKMSVQHEISRCRSIKRAEQIREQLFTPFMSKYLIGSNLYLPEDVESRPYKDQNEYNLYNKVARVQGGNYHRQIITPKLLS